jgi:hypothetical protein
MAGVRITTLVPQAIPGRRYGSFAGKPTALVPTIGVLVGAIMGSVVDSDAAQVPTPDKVGATIVETVTMDNFRYTRTHDRMDLKAGDALDRAVKCDVRSYAYATFEFTVATGAGTWGSAIVTIRRSNDNESYADLETTITKTAAGITAQIDCRGIAFLAAVVTTYQAASCTLNVDFYAYGES